MADKLATLDWPEVYPAGKLKHLSRIKNLLRKLPDPLILQEKHGAAGENQDSAELDLKGPIGAQLEPVVDTIGPIREEEEPEMEPAKRPKLDEADELSIDSVLRHCGDMNPVLCRPNFEEAASNYISQRVDQGFVTQLAQAVNKFPVLEERNFSGILHLLKLYVEKDDLSFPGCELEALFTLFPQWKGRIFSIVFLSSRGPDLLDAVLANGGINQIDLNECLVHVLKEDDIKTSHLGVLESVLRVLHPTLLTDPALVGFIFQAMNRRSDGDIVKCLKTAKFCMGLLTRLPPDIPLDTATREEINTFITANKTFLKKKMEKLAQQL